MFSLGYWVRGSCHRGAILFSFAALLGSGPSQAGPLDRHMEHVCGLIAAHASESSLPPAFLARLIWKESRFDPNAVSPKGAQGIAQFMPGTAKLRGLSDPFDVEESIKAAAAYLSELRTRFGNFGLAAATYNAGEGRVSRWLESGGPLPLETENYVLDIMGEPVANFAKASYSGTVQPVHAETRSEISCRQLPVLRKASVLKPAVRVETPRPWGVQIAGGFNHEVATRQSQAIQRKYPKLLAGKQAVVSRVRSAQGRRGIYAVRIGLESKSAADNLCTALRKAGGACVVMRNK